MQRGGLKPVSKKGAEKRRLEQAKHNINIQEGKVYCVACGSDYHIEKHHYKGRNYPDEFIYVCGEFGCGKHKWIHQNENIAYKEGWLHPQYRGLKENPDWPKPWL